MLSLNFFFWNIFLFLIYIYLEFCGNVIYYNILKNLKFFKLIYTKKKYNFFFKNNFYLFLNILFFFFFF